MSLSYIVEMLDMTQYAIRVASETENHMTSVERVMNYTSIEPEPGYDTGTFPPEQWPHQGALSLCDLSLAYLTDAPKVLNNINITVAPKEKVGIAGRTGAGKSSLVAALFRMPEPEGKVKLLCVFFSQLATGHNGRYCFISHFPSNASSHIRTTSIGRDLMDME